MEVTITVTYTLALALIEHCVGSVRLNWLLGDQ